MVCLLPTNCGLPQPTCPWFFWESQSHLANQCTPSSISATLPLHFSKSSSTLGLACQVRRTTPTVWYCTAASIWGKKTGFFSKIFCSVSYIFSFRSSLMTLQCYIIFMYKTLPHFKCIWVFHVFYSFANSILFQFHTLWIYKIHFYCLIKFLPYYIYLLVLIIMLEFFMSLHKR